MYVPYDHMINLTQLHWSYRDKGHSGQKVIQNNPRTNSKYIVQSIWETDLDIQGVIHKPRWQDKVTANLPRHKNVHLSSFVLYTIGYG